MIGPLSNPQMLQQIQADRKLQQRFSVQIRDAELHLRRAVQFKEEPYTSQAHAMLFYVLRYTNRPDEAEQELEKAVRSLGDVMPPYRKELANWYSRPASESWPNGSSSRPRPPTRSGPMNRATTRPA